jgi:AcrR family transcriptional regulator
VEGRAAAGLRERKPRKDAVRNRARILESAGEAFAELGLDVGVDEIARRAGVGMGTLYRHFPTKDALIDAILDQRLDRLAALAEEALEASDPWSGLVHFVERAVELQAADRGLKDVLSSRRRAERSLTRARARLRPLLERLIERAQEDGSLRGDVANWDIVVLLWATGRIVELTAEVAPGQARRFIALHLDGLRARSASPLPAPPLTARQHARAVERRAERRSGR